MVSNLDISKILPTCQGYLTFCVGTLSELAYLNGKQVQNLGTLTSVVRTFSIICSCMHRRWVHQAADECRLVYCSQRRVHVHLIISLVVGLPE